MQERPQSTYLFVTLMTCIMAVVAAMMVAMFIAAQRPTVVVVSPPAVPPAISAVAATPPPESGRDATLTPATTGATSLAKPAPAPPQILAMRIDSLPPQLGPDDPVWQQAPSVELPLQPQQTAAPFLEHATIQTLAVQSVRDGERIAWRLSWAQAEPSAHVNVGQFSDGVALQIPMVDGAPFTMGGPNMPVHVLYWRALWQKDVDDGFQDVHHQHPNTFVDLYWFATGTNPFPINEAFKDERSHQWLVPYAAGNPLANFKRSSAVEEMVAEGFGSVTTIPDAPSVAQAQWVDGKWIVVIARPLNPSDPVTQRLLSPTASLAFAVWDGQAGNAGGRKHWISWIPLRSEQ